ncbi:hypothetical protein ACROYT_G013838 [Oculina patagonica]
MATPASATEPSLTPKAVKVFTEPDYEKQQWCISRVESKGRASSCSSAKCSRQFEKQELSVQVMARTVNRSQLSYWATMSYKMAIGTEKRVSGQTACIFKVKITNNASLHNSLLYVPGPKVIYSTEGFEEKLSLLQDTNSMKVSIQQLSSRILELETDNESLTAENSNIKVDINSLKSQFKASESQMQDALNWTGKNPVSAPNIITLTYLIYGCSIQKANKTSHFFKLVQLCIKGRIDRSHHLRIESIGTFR